MDPTQTDKSIYRTLDSTISEIRLIQLQRGSGDEGLTCTLETVSLNNQPAFHALSYVWGAGTEKRQVNIDNNVVPVAPSLATVLDHFRSHHYDFLELHSSFLWIDAICINQADPKERAQQVRLMGRIYSQASRVLVWIGEGDEFSNLAFDRINDAAFRASFEELKTASRAPTSDEVRVSAIFMNNLDKRRYWTRAWTLQEFVLATQDPVMFCGSRWMPWSWYRQCERNLPLPTQKMSYPSLASDWVKVKWETPFHPDSKEFTTPTKHETMRGWYQSNGSIPLVTALSQSFQFDATDPRDLIYGVLGLLPHHETPLVEIDYQKPPEQVFRDIVGAIWTSGAPGLISDAIPHLLSVGWADDKSEVPSWVPNVLRGTKTDLGSTAWLSASRRWRPDRQPDIRVEGSILTMNAVRFDSVADTVALQFNHGWQERINRGKAPGELDIEPLQHIEAMARKGLSIPIPASSCLAPFLALRDEMPIWSALTAWEGYGDGGESEGWLAGMTRVRPTMWEILLGRQDIPEDWKIACPPELRNDLPALETFILSSLLRAIRWKVDGRKAFTTRCGFLGVGTKSIGAGDIITFIAGMKFMYVLRPFNDGYRIVGFADVSGLMDWDDLDEAMEAGTLDEERIKIY